ncbi:MAG: 2-dehydropantoate 2-reductase [Pseudomonadota bacterium]
MIVGAGGVGGYFGALLARAGAEVAFIARGAHAQAMREHGLEVRTAEGAFVEPVRFAEPGDVADVVLLAVKMYDLDAAIEAAAPYVGAQTRVVPLQNGVESVAILQAALSEAAVAGGVAGISAHIEAPGVIVRAAPFAWLRFGELDGRASAPLDRLRELGEAAGFEAEHRDDIELQIWNKFTMLAPFATICGHARAAAGVIRETPDLRRRHRALVEEAVAVGRAQGIGLAPDRVDQVVAFLDGQPADMKASMLKDLEAGRRIELEWLAGAVIRLGAATGVPTPVTTESRDAIQGQ